MLDALPPANMPTAIRREAEHGRDRRPRTACSAGEPRSGSVAPSRTAEIGGTRVARSAGSRPATQRHQRAGDHARRRPCGVASTAPGLRQVDAERREQRLQALGDADAEHAAPIAEASTPMTSRLEQHRAQHLPARGAERAQRRELTRALGDRDRDRVEDHERADEQRDAAEREQERADGADALAEVARTPAWPASSPVWTCSDRPTAAARSRARARPARRPWRRRRRSRRTRPGLSKMACAVREVEGGERTRPPNAGAAELADAGDRVPADRPVGLRADRCRRPCSGAWSRCWSRSRPRAGPRPTALRRARAG